MLTRKTAARHAAFLVIMMLSSGVSTGSEMEFSAYTIVGVDYRNEFYERLGQGTQTVPMLRRLKGELDYNFGDAWRFTLGAHYGVAWLDEGKDERDGIGDAYLRYQWPGRRRLQVGRMREQFGFERLTGRSRLATTERSIVSSAFAPGRSLGVGYSNESRHTTWALGVFQETRDDDSPRAVTGRFTWAPVIEPANTLHMGVSASVRDLRGGHFEIRERAEVFRGPNTSRSVYFEADQAELLGAELSWQSDALTMTTEAMTQSTERNDGQKWRYSGYYAQASYILGGGRRPYQRGTLRNVRLSGPGGAWEVVGRFSYLDLRDHAQGSRTGVGLAGINYYRSRDLNFKLHYLRSEITGNTLHDENIGNAVIFRLQYSLF